jgi:hypothetical protein
MADEAAEVVPAQAEVAEASEVPTEAPAPPTEAEREPGGSDGESVYQRRLFRENKQLKEKEAALQAEIVRRDERLRLMEEQNKKPALSSDPPLTIERVEEALREGKVDPIIANRWIAREEIRLTLQAERERERAQATTTKVQAEVAEYYEYIPELREPNSKEFRAAEVEYNRLVSEGHDGADPRTQHLAVRLAHGPLTKFRRQKETDSLTRNTLAPHTEMPGGGGRDRPQTPNINNVSDAQKALWDRIGTSPEDRQKEMKYILQREARKKALGIIR